MPKFKSPAAFRCSYGDCDVKLPGPTSVMFHADGPALSGVCRVSDGWAIAMVQNVHGVDLLVLFCPEHAPVMRAEVDAQRGSLFKVAAQVKA